MSRYTHDGIEAAMSEFRQFLEDAVCEDGVETMIPWRTITRIVTLATGKPSQVTVTATLFPGSEDLKAIARGTAPKCPHCEEFLLNIDSGVHKCPVPAAASGGHTKISYIQTPDGIVEIHQKVNAITRELTVGTERCPCRRITPWQLCRACRVNSGEVSITEKSA